MALTLADRAEMKYLLTVLVIISGATIPFQIAANKRIAEAVRSPAAAAALTIGIGLLTACGVAAVWPGARSSIASLRSIPWWAYLGGICLAFAIGVQIVQAKQESTGPIIALIVAGQLIAAVLLDHFGALGIQRNPVTVWKIAGVLLMAGGAFLLQSRAE
jgi:transporter family-2 protein